MTKKWLALATGVMVGATGWGVAATSIAAPPIANSSHAVAAAKGSVKVRTRQVSPYGTILTNNAGHTLYLFNEDTRGHSHCNGACAQVWPPLLVGKGKTVSGVSGLGTIRRSNGKRQVSLHGRPLYRFSGDATPGQVNGQGVHGTWFVATPHGPGQATTPTSTPTVTPTATPTATQTASDPVPTETPTFSTPPTTPATTPTGGGYGY